MNTSKETLNIYKALIACQAELLPITRNSTNPFFSSEYADMSHVFKSTNAIMKKHGLAIIQGTHAKESSIQIITRLIHVSGEYIEIDCEVLKTKRRYIIKEEGQEDIKKVNKDTFIEEEDPQKIFATVTYIRRMQWLAILGICQECEDEDGNNTIETQLKFNNQIKTNNRNNKVIMAVNTEAEKAVTEKTITEKKDFTYKNPEAIITQPQLFRLKKIISNNNIAREKVNEVLHEYNIDKEENIKMKDYNAICDRLSSSKKDDAESLIYEHQKKIITFLMNSLNMNNIDKITFLQKFGYNTVQEILKKHYDVIVKELNKMLKEKKDGKN